MSKPEKNTFYNEDVSECLTYLEFGSIDTKTSEKKVWDFRLHQEAYDFLMLARYMKDLITYRQLSQSIASTSADELLTRYNADVYTHDLYNSFSKIAALNVCHQDSQPASFLELGSTLMGCIDAMEFVHLLAHKQNSQISDPALQSVEYHAVDISPLLNSVAQIIHPGYSIQTYLDYHELDFDFDVFFAKGVSLLYAISSAEELAKLLNKARISTFDYSLTLEDEQQQQYLGTGKCVTYFSASKLLDSLNNLNPSKHLFIHVPTAAYDQNKGRIRAVFYCGSESDINKSISEEEKIVSALESQLQKEQNKSLLYYRDIKCPVGEYVLFVDYLKSLERQA